jgi:hypothetical protein
MLPEEVKGPLANPLARGRPFHQWDLPEGHGRVELPFALTRNYPTAPTGISWLGAYRDQMPNTVPYAESREA